MNVTRIYIDTLRALLNNKRYIINKGGSRSSKTFSELQVFKTIADHSKKNEVNTIVSHSLPHLKGGAIRDFDNILISEGIEPDSIRIKNPYEYKLGSQIIEFVSFDKIGKALGGARDRLFINEANKMPFAICHHLMQRTTGSIFIDYNPSHKFWIDDNGYITNPESEVIHSTFLDNIQNLSEGQIYDFQQAKIKAEIEEANDNKGYWFNWWRVYGLGLDGIVEGAIFHNWKVGEFDNSLPHSYGLDFGSRDPDALIKCAIDRSKNKIYLKEEIYTTGLSSGQLLCEIKSKGVDNKLIIADSQATRTITDLKLGGLNIRPVIKTMIVEGIKIMQDWEIIIDPESINLIREFTNYVWLDRKGEIPSDTENHGIDASRYIITTILNHSKLKKTKLI